MIGFPFTGPTPVGDSFAGESFAANDASAGSSVHQPRGSAVIGSTLCRRSSVGADGYRSVHTSDARPEGVVRYRFGRTSTAWQGKVAYRPAVVASAVGRQEAPAGPDPASRPIADGWRTGVVKALEREFSAFVPPSAENASFTTAISVDQTPEEAFAAINNVRGWWQGNSTQYPE